MYSQTTLLTCKRETFTILTCYILVILNESALLLSLCVYFVVQIKVGGVFVTCYLIFSPYTS
jgi:uncharacterized membrane protein